MKNWHVVAMPMEENVQDFAVSNIITGRDFIAYGAPSPFAQSNNFTRLDEPSQVYHADNEGTAKTLAQILALRHPNYTFSVMKLTSTHRYPVNGTLKVVSTVVSEKGILPE